MIKKQGQYHLKKLKEYYFPKSRLVRMAEHDKCISITSWGVKSIEV